MKILSRENTARYAAITAMLGALSFALQLLAFPLPFLIPSFIEFDFSDLPALIASFSMGPVSGVMVALIKNVLHLTVTTTAGVGELANFLLTASFVVVAGCIYRFRKNRSGALLGSLTGTLAMTVLSVPINLFITYPVYYEIFAPEHIVLGAYQAILPFVKDIYTCLWLFNAPFNFAKGAIVTLIAFLIYKHISPLIKGKGVHGKKDACASHTDKKDSLVRATKAISVVLSVFLGVWTLLFWIKYTAFLAGIAMLLLTAVCVGVSVVLFGDKGKKL